MGTKAVVIGDIRSKHAPEMPLVEDDDLIERIAPDTPDEPLAVGILPRTARGDLDFFAQFIAVCSSVKPCEIGENLLSVSGPISRLQEKLIHVGALIRPPTLQRRPVSGLHQYAAVER